jgi:hypothetical protein
MAVRGYFKNPRLGRFKQLERNARTAKRRKIKEHVSFYRSNFKTASQLTALFTALNSCTKFAMLRYATAMASIVSTYAH